MIQQIKRQIKDVLAQKEIETQVPIKKPPQPEMGDLSFPCFQPAQNEAENPKKLAKRLTELNFNEPINYFSKVEAAGPYLNFYLDTKLLAEKFIQKLNNQSKEYFDKKEKHKKVMIEYPSPNTHKRFHVGHLRNVCIGNCLRELYKTQGYKVIPVNYVNDLGAHVAKSIWGIQNLYDGKVPEENIQEWLGKVYSESAQKIEKNEHAQKEVEEIKGKIEEEDKKVRELFLKTRDKSLKAFQEILDELNVEHETTYFESDMIERGQEIIDELLEEGIAKEGKKGAIIVDLEEYGLDTAIVRKRDGMGLYITGDLALAEEKFNTYPDLDESIYITGNEQQHHFKQLFKILELFGFDKKMTHIGYGLISLESGKMSSREGSVILYEELKQKVYKKLQTETKNRHPDWKKDKINNTAEKLTQAVLKFDLQKHEAKKNITFDIEEATNFNGYSAPYVLYVYARINSLKEKADINLNQVEIDYTQLNKDLDHKLLTKMTRLEETIDQSFNNYDPAKITKFCFDLAQLFNDYYSKHQIITKNKKKTKARLFLVDSVQTTLKKALGILTIEPIEEM